MLVFLEDHPCNPAGEQGQHNGERAVHGWVLARETEGYLFKTGFCHCQHLLLLVEQHAPTKEEGCDLVFACGDVGWQVDCG